MNLDLAYGEQAALEQEEITHGRVSVGTDTQSLFFDLDGNRINIKDVFFVSSLPEVLLRNKFYIDIENGIFAYLDGGGTVVKKQGLSETQMAQLKVNTSIRVSEDEPEEKNNAGDVWLVLEE